MPGGPRTKPLMDRVYARSVVEDHGYVTACTSWIGCRNPAGYGAMMVGSRTDGSRRLKGVHRAVWEHLNGPVPEGKHLDHLCRNPACWNPDHLEVVTARENTLRGVSVVAENAGKDRCLRGHEFNPENTRVTTGRYGPGRTCRRCDRDRKRIERAIA